jgi:preprotein translocase subunit SecG
VFLILLVLIQRGKGGGLVGALGGTGGSSAFGARAGDTFTKVTLGVAVLWILLNMGLVVAMQPAPKAPAEDAVTGAPPVPTETP